MLNTLVRRDQFNITVEGVVHKPTQAAFIPDPADPYNGTIRSGQLGSQLPNGEEYCAEDVKRMMKEVWAEFISTNANFFRSKSALSD
jgi:hypothetical protein